MLQQIYPTPQHEYEFELNKDMHFASAHYIPHEEAGDCQKVHGHTYFANITIAGNELDESGFLINFQQIKKLIHKRFDHSLLNDDSRFSDKDPMRFPTTEVVAKAVCEIVQEHLETLKHRPQCLQVFLRETPTSYVIYRPKKGMKS
ncbi:6-carboxytetrahydropterin synthase QueD [Bacillus haikouensis]|jgi:6-pyruvoyltetrahydropterin/6-carboxytetrahydropterin synthase|uniref:6-carboxytetrahydropterin synthase QueD n=1 Tax=Bacillus haikouensis TaxID=1510468 RepID=UPI0015547BDD|nr:6-carboxytetrahydropterin synthase QueD [Bacillus haikouensis]NQD68662.1 6-carboxytetrahydropterin synthase QueD [Bacillus haikouensis]